MGASGGGWPFTVPLRDGSQARVTPQGVHIGERFYELGRLQDARQTAPDPETVGLRVADAGLVEFQPARPGDGARALATIYMLRPDLRPAGFEPPPAPGWPAPPAMFPPPPGFPPPGVPPYPLYGAPLYGAPVGQPGAFPPPPPGGPVPGFPPAGAGAFPPPPPPGMFPPPPGFPPPGFPPAPGFAPPGAPPPQAFNPYLNPYLNRNDGTITPRPRDFGETLSAIFSLYGKRFRTWVTLGLIVSAIPAFLLGGFSVVQAILLGENPLEGWLQRAFASAQTPAQPQQPQLNPTHTLILALTGLALGVLTLFFSAWQIGALSIAGRDALFGREIHVEAVLRASLRRILPIFATSLLTGLLLVGVLLPFALLFLLILVGTGAFGALLYSDGSSASSSVGIGLLGLCGGYLVYFGGAVFAAYVSVRVGLAPYATATEGLGPIAAIRRSWQLTHLNFWRTLGVIFIIGLILELIGLVALLAQVFSVAVGSLIVSPLVSAILAPLTALTYIVLLYDLRLRREGYGPIAAERGEAPAPPLQASPPQQSPQTAPSPAPGNASYPAPESQPPFQAPPGPPSA